jgi:uncharacterized protein YlxW (UPF0749 family)
MQAFAQLDLETLLRIAAEEQQAPYSRPAVDAALEESIPQVQQAVEALQAARQDDGDDVGGEPAGTARYDSVAPVTDDELEQIDSMAGLKAVAGPLGVTITPGTSKVRARELIREARAAAAEAVAA